MLKWFLQKLTSTATDQPETRAPTPAESAAGDSAKETRSVLAQAIEHEKSGRIADAVHTCEKLLRSDPENTDALCLLGRLQMHQSNFAGAEATLQKAVALAPRATDPRIALGRLELKRGRKSVAKGHFEAVLSVDPDSAGAHYGLGNVHMADGQLDKALACFAAAIARNGALPEAHCNSGVVFESKREPEKAIAAYRRALAANPDLSNAHFNLAILLMKGGDREGALRHIDKVAALAPDTADTWDIKGRLHQAMGEMQAAVDAYTKAVSIDPGLHEVHNSLGVAHQMLGNYNAALAALQAAVASKPDFISARSNLGMALQFMGRSDEAIETLKEAAEASPDAAHIQSNFLFCVSHSERIRAEEIFEAHRAFGERFEAPLRPNWAAHANQRDPERKLQVGFVSADLYAHAVSTFIEPVWSALDPNKVEVWAYANSMNEDLVTQQLRSLCKHWRVVTSLSDADLAEQIRADGIDILFDLSGHSAGNRLLTFARKPAPIQATWIGNPNTTGLTAMDYYFADRFCAPPGLLDSLFTEKIVQLAASTVFQPVNQAPEVNDLPALRNSGLTFGTFARSNKLTAGTIALWSRVLNAVPGSQMIVGSMSDTACMANVTQQFGEHGVAAERLSFHPRMEMGKYLALHGRVDIVLDTYPFGGGTTSCHALWMGVPVLSLAGKTMASRVGASLNGFVGLPDFTVDSADEFVARAVYWSQRLPELARLRAGLRQRTLESPLCQPNVVAQTLEAALRQMWRRWCEGLPPQSFEAAVK